MVEVDGPIRAGVYDGSIELRSPETGGSLPLRVHLTAAATTTVALAGETPHIAIKRASRCYWATAFVLGAAQCETVYT